MDLLWAPWRSKYVTAANSIKGCIFCLKPKARRDKANYIVSRGRRSFSMLNLYPYNNGHVMLAPYRHIKELRELTEEEAVDLFGLLKETEGLLARALKPGGYNIGMNLGRVAGAGYEGHLHIHIVPRWAGDVNFMPVSASTKVVSQSLDALYLRLKDAQTRRDRRG